MSRWNAVNDCLWCRVHCICIWIWIRIQHIQTPPSSPGYFAYNVCFIGGKNHISPADKEKKMLNQERNDNCLWWRVLLYSQSMRKFSVSINKLCYFFPKPLPELCDVLFFPPAGYFCAISSQVNLEGMKTKLQSPGIQTVTSWIMRPILIMIVSSTLGLG